MTSQRQDPADIVAQSSFWRNDNKSHHPQRRTISDAQFAPFRGLRIADGAAPAHGLKDILDGLPNGNVKTLAASPKAVSVQIDLPCDGDAIEGLVRDRHGKHAR